MQTAEKTRDMLMQMARRMHTYLRNQEVVDFGIVSPFMTEEDIARKVRRARELHHRIIRDRLELRS